MRKLWFVGALVTAFLFSMVPIADAQRGPGGNRGPGRLPSLQIEDVTPQGAYEVVNLLPGSNDQPRLGVTGEMAYRLVGYDRPNRELQFATLDFESGALGSTKVKLSTKAPDLGDDPRMAYDGGEWAVITRQAATVFVNVADGKVAVASEIDNSVPLEPVEASAKTRRRPARNGQEYRVHGGAGGKWALSVYVEYDPEAKEYISKGGKVHFPKGKSVELEWDHNKYGVPPGGRDAVCAVTDDEIVVLTTNPRSPGAFKSACDLTCLVFDTRGNLKEAQTSPDPWAGNNAERFALSPDGKHVVAHPEDSLHRSVVTRGTWERGYRTNYHDALVGFAPEGALAVFIENHTPERAALKALKLPGGEEVWNTTLTHKQVEGEGDNEPFTSVGPGAAVIAMRSGILKGESAEEPAWIYKVSPVEFEPLCISYDSGGKLVAVLALDRVFVIEAKSREEVYSVPLDKALPKGALGEFVTFDSRGDKVMACARGHGVWVIDLKEGEIVQSLPALPGTWARAMPDFSGVVYSQRKEDGGNVMLQKLEGGEPERIYRCEYKDALAICFHINDKCDEFLVAEREVGVGRLFLVDEEGEKIVTYDVENEDTMYVGDETVTGFVTRRKQAVLINEVQRWRYTGINCTVVSPKKGGGLEANFSAVFESSDLPGRSTYGATAASPFFGGLFAGDERECTFACPAGVLQIDIRKSTMKLHAWSREPSGLAAVNPKGKEFFVAGTNGLTTYSID